MSFNPPIAKMNKVKDANAIEGRRLEKQIRGHAGIESQRRFQLQQTRQECDLLRQELAEMYLTRKGRKGQTRDSWDIKTIFDNDTTLWMMEERENIRRSKNRKLLYRAKQKDKLMDDMVKEFVVKLETDKKLQANPRKVQADDAKVLENSTSMLQGCSSEMKSDDAKDDVIPFFRSMSHVWQEAQKTRYVRARALRDFEIELTPKEIFGGGGI